MMKKLTIICVIFCGLLSYGQSNINDLLIAGIDDAERYTNAYLNPLQEGVLYSMGNGWYNTADAKPLLGFEIGVVGNLSFYKDDKKSFIMDISEYESLRFSDASVSKEVSTALGDIQGINVVATTTVDDQVFVSDEFELPSGLASEDISFVPTAYIQAGVGLVKGLEIKARFLPKMSFDDDNVEIGLFGVGLQSEFTKWLPADKLLPVAISGVIGYTNLNGTYNFTETSGISGSDQRLETDFSVWTFQAVVSTKLPVINFYGGLGYLSGSSDIDVLGTYEVSSGSLPTVTYVDPFSVSEKASGVIANVGFKLKLAVLRINADYSIGEFNNVSVGVNFGFR